MGKRFVTVGTKKILVELFQNISRPHSTYMFKPSGGLWFTKYDENKNEWLDFVKNHKYLYQHKLSSEAAIATLSDSINIANITSDEDLIHYSSLYPNQLASAYYYYPPFLRNRYLIDYEKLAKDYDGVYIKLDNITEVHKKSDRSYAGELGFFDVNSLVIFNLNHISLVEEARVIRTRSKSIILPTGSYHSIKKPHDSYFNLCNYLENLFLKMIEDNKNKLYSEDYISYIQSIKALAKSLLKRILLYPPEELVLFYKDYGIKESAKILESIICNIMIDYIANDDVSILKKPKRYSIGNF